MTGNLYPAETLLQWGVVNRVLAGRASCSTKSRRFAARLAAGPTVAHAATKAIVARAGRSRHARRGRPHCAI